MTKLQGRMPVQHEHTRALTQSDFGERVCSGANIPPCGVPGASRVQTKDKKTVRLKPAVAPGPFTPPGESLPDRTRCAGRPGCPVRRGPRPARAAEVSVDPV